MEITVKYSKEIKNKKFWQEYYQNQQPTPFAKFCLSYIPLNALIIDIGCGNGRDTYFFAEKKHHTIGIDYAFKPRPLGNARFLKMTLLTAINTLKNFPVTYSRFFLHSISTKQIISLIKWSKKFFMAEFRDKTDEPVLFKDHSRNKVDGEWVKELLIKNHFEILFYGKSKGWAVYKYEDPLVVRIIAKRK